MRNPTNSKTLPILVAALSIFVAARCQPLAAQDGELYRSASVVVDDLTGEQGIPMPIPSMPDAVMLSEADFYSPALPADCGMGCAPEWYVRGELVFFANESNGPVSLSNNFVLPEFSYETGLRITAGRRRDCSEGWEVSYLGPLEWISDRDLSGSLLSTKILSPGGELSLSAFNQAEYHRQTYISKLSSIEINQRFYDWDTMSCLLGVRYIDVRESFNFFSLNDAPGPEETGLFTVRTHNRLIGPHAGVDILYPVGVLNGLTIGAKARVGLYANFANGNVRLINADVVELDNADERVQVAFCGEFGYFAKFHVTPRLSLYGGYEIMYLAGLGLAHGQTVSPLTANTGRRVNTGQDTWYHGASGGVQFTW